MMVAGALGFVESMGGNQTLEVATRMRYQAAAFYCLSGVVQFIALALVYNLDKKTMAQMSHDLGRDVYADDIYVPDPTMEE